MKIIITESKLYQAVIDYLNETYDVDNIHWTYATDDWGNEIDAVNFYEGDFGDGEDLFKWYDKGYWESDVIDPYYSNENLKKWVEQSTNQTPKRTCLNCESDINHRLKMVKYCTDKCRLERFYKMKKS